MTYVERAADVIALAADLAASGSRFALVTSLEIEGGAARDVGSLALVREDGEMVGYLSNGCIDQDIRHHALETLKTKESRVIRYGEGSRYMDLRLPCGGALSVLINPGPDLPALRAAAARLSARIPADLEFMAASQGEHPARTYSFRYAPPVHLVLAGRGAVFRATADAGRAAGFDLTLLSPEEADLIALAALRPKGAQHLTAPANIPDLPRLDRWSAFLTLFHDHDWEPHLLRSALATEVGFIGSLGSRRTHQLRREGLRSLGVAGADLDRLRGPIGVVPSLRSAPFIAISALAEVIGHLPPQIAPAEHGHRASPAAPAIETA